MKAIVIDEPWISAILRSEKTWEMRKMACHQRGQIALIRKGSGMVVGTAKIAGSLPPLRTMPAYADAVAFHCIPPERQKRAFADGWTTPWVFEDARPLPSPVSYQHPSGAVIWVNLNAAVIAAISAQKADHLPAPMPVPLPTIRPSAPTKIAPAVNLHLTPPSRPVAALHPTDTRTAVITGGNVRNSHIYLPLDFFPDDTIGGRNNAAAAPRTISVTFQPGTTIKTDIDRTKRILRMRGPISDFLAGAGLDDGDAVLITCHSPYAYTVSKAPHD